MSHEITREHKTFTRQELGEIKLKGRLGWYREVYKIDDKKTIHATMVGPLRRAQYQLRTLFRWISRQPLNERKWTILTADRLRLVPLKPLDIKTPPEEAFPLLCTYKYRGGDDKEVERTTFALGKQESKQPGAQFDVYVPGDSVQANQKLEGVYRSEASEVTVIDDSATVQPSNDWPRIVVNLEALLNIAVQSDLPQRNEHIKGLQENKGFLQQWIDMKEPVNLKKVVTTVHKLIDSTAHLQQQACESTQTIMYHPPSEPDKDIQELPVLLLVDFYAEPLIRTLRNELQRSAEVYKNTQDLAKSIISPPEHKIEIKPTQTIDSSEQTAMEPAAPLKTVEEFLDNALNDKNALKTAADVVDAFETTSYIDGVLWSIAAESGTSTCFEGEHSVSGVKYTFLNPNQIKEKCASVKNIAKSIDGGLDGLLAEPKYQDVRNHLTLIRDKYLNLLVALSEETLDEMTVQTANQQLQGCVIKSSDWEKIKITTVDHSNLKSALQQLNRMLREEQQQSFRTFLLNLALLGLKGGKEHQEQMNTGLEKIRDYICEHDPRMKVAIGSGQFGVANYIFELAIREVFGVAGPQEYSGLVDGKIGGGIGQCVANAHNYGAAHFVCRLATADGQYHELDTVGTTKEEVKQPLSEGLRVDQELWEKAPKIDPKSICLAQQRRNNCYLSAGWLQFCALLHYHYHYCITVGVKREGAGLTL